MSVLLSIVKWLVKQFEEQHRDKYQALCGSPHAMLSLLHAAESAKCALSTKESYTIRVPGVLDAGSDWVQVVTREQLNDIIGPTLRITLDTVNSALSDGKVAKEQVDQIVLAGGSTGQSHATSESQRAST